MAQDQSSASLLRSRRTNTTVRPSSPAHQLIQDRQRYRAIIHDRSEHEDRRSDATSSIRAPQGPVDASLINLCGTANLYSQFAGTLAGFAFAGLIASIVAQLSCDVGISYTLQSYHPLIAVFMALIGTSLYYAYRCRGSVPDGRSATLETTAGIRIQCSRKRTFICNCRRADKTELGGVVHPPRPARWPGILVADAWLVTVGAASSHACCSRSTPC